MTASSSSNSSCCSEAGTGSAAWLNGRGGLAVAAIALGGAALWFGWPWLVVAGVAPLLISLAPCLLMCGAMCALKMCSKGKQGTITAEASPTVFTNDGAAAQLSAPTQFSQGAVQAPAVENRTPA